MLILSFILLLLIGKPPAISSAPTERTVVKPLCLDANDPSIVCKMPRITEGIRFTPLDDDARVLVPGEVLENIILKVECIDGYKLDGWEIIFCVGKMWITPISKCLRMCRLWKDHSVKYLCDNVTTATQCPDFVAAGSVVEAQCEENYNPRNISYMRCKDDGYFDHVADCKPNDNLTGKDMCLLTEQLSVNYFCNTTSGLEQCGDFVPIGEVVTVKCKMNYTYEGTIPKMTCMEFNVFDQNVVCNLQGNDTDLLRSGISDSNDTANEMTAKKCIMPDLEGMEGTQYIVNGKNHSVPDTEHSIIHIITTCNPGYTLFGHEQVYCFDGEWLTRLPICLRSCRLWKEVGYSHICYYLMKQVECQDNVPAGTEVSIDCEEGYMRDTSEGARMTCTDDGYFNFIIKCRSLTNFTDCMLWDDPTVNFFCDGPYGLTTCFETVPAGTEVTARCKDNFVTVNSLKLMTCGEDGYFDAFPECVAETSIMCYLEKDISVNYYCETTTGSAMCETSLFPGTVVRSQCRDKYTYYGKMEPMICDNLGHFNYVAKCIPDGFVSECGLSYRSSPLIMGVGHYGRVDHGEVPWHAGIYTKNTRPYMQLCGGTIITPKYIISAAHCFWYDKQKAPAANYAVAVGKIYRPWNDAKDVHAQKSNISEIHLPTHYRDSDTRYQDDIALLILETAIQFNTFVMPACLDLNEQLNSLQLLEGNMGKVSGWGYTTAEGNPSPYLNKIRLPYVETRRCLDESSPSFVPYITNDKFCAGYKNANRSVCRGDSGGGLVFNLTVDGVTRYFLQGVVSTAPAHEIMRCNGEAWTVFTHVYKERDFLRKFFILNDSEENEYLYLSVI